MSNSHAFFVPVDSIRKTQDEEKMINSHYYNNNNFLPNNNSQENFNSNNNYINFSKEISVLLMREGYFYNLREKAFQYLQDVNNVNHYLFNQWFNNDDSVNNNQFNAGNNNSIVRYT